MIKHTAIRESIDAANRLIQKYSADYNRIDQNLKPEVQAERRKKLYDDFSTAISEHMAILRAGAYQLKGERQKAGDAFDSLLQSGMANLPSMSAGEAWMASAMDKVPTAGIEAFTNRVISTGSDSLKFGLFLHLVNEKTPEAAKALDTLMANVKKSPQTQSHIIDIARLEKAAHEALLAYEARPGTGKSMQSQKVEVGHLINKLDQIITEASDYARPAA